MAIMPTPHNFAIIASQVGPLGLSLYYTQEGQHISKGPLETMKSQQNLTLPPRSKFTVVDRPLRDKVVVGRSVEQPIAPSTQVGWPIDFLVGVLTRIFEDKVSKMSKINNYKITRIGFDNGHPHPTADTPTRTTTSL